jgi:hypothetical protein
LLDIFALIREAMTQRAQVWAYLEGQAVHFCPRALGWRGDEAYVLALVLPDRFAEGFKGGTRQGRLGWRWLRLADLRIPALRRGEWISFPRDQQPATSFLTRVYCEAE